MVTTQPSRRSLTPRFVPTFAREMDQLGANLRRMFDNPFLPAADLLAEMPQAIGWMPPVEIRESDAALRITAELPGMKLEDVHVELEGDLLTIRGEKQEERTEGDEKAQYHLTERSYGAFHRSFTLPANVNTDQVNAAFAKGVLTVELPKTTEPRPRGRTIEITSK